jgi:uncharacterized membrane protein YhaH (DUF805 family)
MGLGSSLRHNLSRLLRFGGRLSPAHFWPYAGFVIVLTMVGMAVAMLPFLFETMTRMQRFALAHPDQATVTSGPGSYSISIQGSHPELFPDMTPVMIGMAMVFAIAIVLLAAATVRRLHDSGRTGLWGVMPIPFIAFSCARMARLFTARDLDMAVFFSVFVSNLLYLLSLGLLVVLLVRPGTIGVNRFGVRDDDAG